MSESHFTDNDAAVQIAEEAFRAGYEAAGGTGNWYDAWSDFEPSEASKELAACATLSTMVLFPDTDSPFSLLYGEEASVVQKYPTSPAFPGYVIGWYQRLDGPRGYVLQHERDRIVHVYPEQAVVEGFSL